MFFFSSKRKNFFFNITFWRIFHALVWFFLVLKNNAQKIRENVAVHIKKNAYVIYEWPLSKSFVDHYVDVLFALNKKYFDNLCQWLTSLVNTDGFPSANVNKDQKQQFASLILKERANKRKFQEIVREFSLACSGLAGTQQAVQMAQVLNAWDKIGEKAEQKIENQAALAATNAAK